MAIEERTVDATTSTLSGAWIAEFSDSTYNDGGSISGGTQAGRVTLTLATSSGPRPCEGGGSLFVSGTVDGRRMSGQYVVFNCEVVYSGSVDVAKAD